MLFIGLIIYFVLFIGLMAYLMKVAPLGEENKEGFHFTKESKK